MCQLLTHTITAHAVDGSAIPNVNFDIGESYSGLLPVSGDVNETRNLFYWFFPSTAPEGSNDITIWLNGGPGCSSLAGLLQENGPFLWLPGTQEPVPNNFSWTNLTNLLFVEQPVGTGFSTGVPNIQDEVELADQFAGFYEQFAKTFGLEEFDVYLTGESYAGYYVPYIADAFIQRNDTCYFNIKGISINDPFIGYTTDQQVIPMVPFAIYWNNLLNLNESFLEQVQHTADVCNYTDYYDTYLTFPPPEGPFPKLPIPIDENIQCNVFYQLQGAAYASNACFDTHYIASTCPQPWSVIGELEVEPENPPPPHTLYFDRQDVKAAIHAPLNTTWKACVGSKGTFVNEMDNSDSPTMNGVLTRVIEFTNNAIIGSGNLDMLLPTNGTLLAIQNMTWNGLQGFQGYPGQSFVVPFGEFDSSVIDGVKGTVGQWGSERGLTFYQVQKAGHQLPMYAPSAAYRMLEFLLGQVSTLGETD
ncbi:alpha/beta-hydrolase [Polychaeton citri CBS 116435]|uniref:Carboxypeptidase n=1 Tax=Polychaeton citri CBS 116435 TaxID=1314669 RepID=A0A9P4Q115_9PEZI|nr:alpha/beta-hydrolase [Polychaeton citri CBS 116435]